MTPLDRARRLWCALASGPVAFPPTGVTVVVSPYSLLGPPGWCGVVSLGPSASATVPSIALKPLVEAALRHLPAADTTDPRQLRAALPVTQFLGPAALAYLDPAEFTPPARLIPPATASVERDDPGVAKLLAAVPIDDAGESGLDEITSPAVGRVWIIRGHRRRV
jgi:hypothetical protein